jgi:hypothetical protein
MKEQIEANYKQVKKDVIGIIANEIDRIKNDSNLTHLLKDL